MLRPRKDISINTLKISMDNSDLSTLCNIKFPELIYNNKIIATYPEIKLFIIGEYLESIHSPRYTNIGTSTKIKVDKVAEETKKMKNNMRNKKQTFVDFSKENPAYYPKKFDDDDPKFLFNYIEVSLILKKLKNKNSSGLDNIPTVVLKNQPEPVIKDYTIIFNNAINNVYYPSRWKAAKVLPIPKKDKNPELLQSYRPISLTMSRSKIF